MNRSAGPKMTIRPYRVQSLMSKENAETLWKKLEKAFEEIYNRNSSKLFFEELYRTAYNLVLQKHGEYLYHEVCECFRLHAEKTREEVLKASDSNLLSKLCEEWDDTKTTVSKIKDIVMYMDSTYVSHQKIMSVYGKGITIFRDCVVFNSVIREKIRRFLLNNIQAERKGEIVDTETIKSILNMLVELGIDGTTVYETEFEEPFLSMTKTFYREEHLLYSAQYACSEYVKKVEARFSEESGRVVRYLSNTTEPKLRNILNSELISNNAESIVEMDSGARRMMKDNQYEELAGLFRLLDRVPHCLSFLFACMGDFIKNCGADIASQKVDSKENQSISYVQSIIQLKTKFDHIVQDCFKKDSKALLVLKESFEEVLSKDSRVPAFVAGYIDHLLKSGHKEFSDADTEEKMDEAVVVVRHLRGDRDVFEHHYKLLLAKRLLNKKFFIDIEKSMIRKLKSDVANEFAAKIQGMLADIHISELTQEEFFASQHSQRRTVDFSVTVLTACVWPSTSNDTSCNLPRVIQEQCLDPFTAFYGQKHNGRKLTWQLHLGNAEVRGNFAKEKRDLCVSTYQMCILMKFNELDADGNSPKLSLQQIRDAVQIPEPELSRHLLSLCTPKFRVLCKSSKGKGISQDDCFTVNFSFTSKLRKVKIPLVSMKDVNKDEKTEAISADSSDQLPPNVLEYRRLTLEAAIVRIMKARKTLSHNDLTAEVMRQVSHRFNPDTVAIKKRIECLIDRDYIMRDADDRKIYKYLA